MTLNLHNLYLPQNSFFESRRHLTIADHVRDKTQILGFLLTNFNSEKQLNAPQLLIDKKKTYVYIACLN